MAAHSRKRNLILAVLVILIAFGIVYIKLKYFLRPKDELFKQKPTTSIPSVSSPLHTESSTDSALQATSETTYKGTIHVAVSVDSADFPAVPTMLNSLRQHHSSNLVVHILVSEKLPKLKSLIDCCKIDLEVDLLEFKLSQDFKDAITVTGSSVVYGNLSSVANFARFSLHKIFPSLTHVLYLDVDSVIQHDLSALWLEIINGDQLITSTTIPNRSYGTYLKPIVKAIFDKRHSNSLDMDTPCIIGGMYGVNLELWRTLDIDKEVIFWMREHQKRHMWSLGSQPILMLVAYGRLKVVSRKWNLTGLGWNTKFSPEELHNWYILHWNGKRKPWLKGGLYKEAWEHFVPESFNVCIES